MNAPKFPRLLSNIAQMLLLELSNAHRISFMILILFVLSFNRISELPFNIFVVLLFSVIKFRSFSYLLKAPHQYLH